MSQISSLFAHTQNKYHTKIYIKDPFSTFKTLLKSFLQKYKSKLADVKNTKRKKVYGEFFL